VRKWIDAVKGARARDQVRPRHALRSLPTAAGRWSLLGAPRADALDVEASARALLARYGVVFRDMLVRESTLPPWRELAVVYRRLEARGEIRGGRFVHGFVGEQFALPEAVEELRAVRHPGNRPELVKIAATDPLNLVGVLSPGPRVASVVGNAVLYKDGIAIASLEGGVVTPPSSSSPARRSPTRWCTCRPRAPPRRPRRPRCRYNRAMSTREIVERYFTAWTTNDVATARACLADDLEFAGPSAHYTSAEQFEPALKGFAAMTKGARVIEFLVDGDKAALLYDCELPGGTTRIASFFRVANGKIRWYDTRFDPAALPKRG
jgi:hypothetical protein